MSRAPAALLGLGLFVLCSWMPEDQQEGAAAAVPPPPPPCPYDENPEHAWNRLHHTLFVRYGPAGEEYGWNEPRPLLWADSTYLLRTPRFERALSNLRGFATEQAWALRPKPLPRALLYHDLWTLADHLIEVAYSPDEKSRVESERSSTLLDALTPVLNGLALAREEIEGLPDNFALEVASEHSPALPVDLFAPEGPWVLLADEADPEHLLAPLHTRGTGGRTVFTVHLSLPESRAQALEYLQALAGFAPASLPCTERCGGYRCPGPGAHRRLNPDTPKLPAGSAVALVERLVLVDRSGALVPSPIVRSVQVRLLTKVTSPEQAPWDASSWDPTFQPAQLDLFPRALLNGEGGGLVACSADDRPLDVLFGAHGDPFLHATDAPSGPPCLSRCSFCHGAPGIFSVNSYTGVMSGPATQLNAALFEELPRLRANDSHWARPTVNFKTRRFDWGVLTVLLEHDRRTSAVDGKR